LLAGFVTWVLLDATVLQHNADVNSPPGSRRTVALDVLGPIAAVARAVGLDLPVARADVALGRTADGGFVNPTVPTTAPGATTTTTTVPHDPSARHPLRVLIFGDSLAEDVAAPLLADLEATGAARVFTYGQISTGITRPDYFNWVAHLRYDVYLTRPDVVIGMLGANDAQGIPGPPYLAFNTPEWRAQYLRNAGQLFSAGRKGGRAFVWISVPTIADKGRNAEWGVVRALQHRAAAEHGVHYFDADAVLAPNGRYAAYLRVGGELALVRQPDGIHLTPAGGALLARSVLVSIERSLRVTFPR
jgi:uncharacterized protein